jgi:hypothetical protein
MFNEQSYLRLLFLLSDTHEWLQNMEHELLLQLPLEGSRKNLFRKSYFLTVTAMAHIVERHYHKIQRHPDTGKFTIDLPDILHWIREAKTAEPTLIAATQNFYRCLDTGICIGFDKHGLSTTIITVITSPDGRIQTAFPGRLGE